MNFTFGDCYAYDPEHNYLQFNPDTTVDYVEPVLEEYFRQNVDGSADLLKAKWKNYRETILSTENILQTMQSNRDYLVETGAFGREVQKWSEVNNTTDLSVLEDFVINRMDYLDRYFDNFK